MRGLHTVLQRLADAFDDPLAIAAVALALVVGALLGAATVARSRRRRSRRRVRAAHTAEVDAGAALRDLGFEVLASQAAGQAHVVVDGARMDASVRADYLVRRWGREAIVEVKNGETCREPHEADTRRQLLEYALVFPGRALYHLDAVTGTLSRIRFEYRPRSSVHWGLWVVAALITAAALVVARR